MDQKFVNTVAGYLQQKLMNALMEAANLTAQLEAAEARVAELEAAAQAQADSEVEPEAKPSK